ncbi:MAG TPA: MBL fold metallo-hydrolase RNA specificity domain-containing protein, partial [Paludibacter sp.]
SLGARIQEPGLREISIFGTKHSVKARIAKIEAFSGHADYREMMMFLSCQTANLIKKTFLVHGEYQVQKFYAEELKKAGFQDIEIPVSGEEFEL